MRLDTTQTPWIGTEIEGTVEDLRMIADKADYALRNALPGQKIVIRIGDSFSFSCKSETPLYGAKADGLRGISPEVKNEQHLDS